MRHVARKQRRNERHALKRQREKADAEQSESDPGRHYTGVTTDVDSRVEWHNHGLLEPPRRLLQVGVGQVALVDDAIALGHQRVMEPVNRRFAP